MNVNLTRQSSHNIVELCKRWSHPCKRQSQSCNVGNRHMHMHVTLFLKYPYFFQIFKFIKLILVAVITVLAVYLAKWLSGILQQVCEFRFILLGEPKRANFESIKDRSYLRYYWSKEMKEMYTESILLETNCEWCHTNMTQNWPPLLSSKNGPFTYCQKAP